MIKGKSFSPYTYGSSIPSSIYINPASPSKTCFAVFPFGWGWNHNVALSCCTTKVISFSSPGLTLLIKNTDPVPLYSETSLRTYSKIDPNVNMLRAGNEAFSAILGGTDMLTVYPHTILTESTEASERLARVKLLQSLGQYRLV